MSQVITTIGTHNGAFHTDDIFAVATLLLLYPDTEVVRSRDATVLASCDIVVDVGGVYNHEQQKYDHHQQGFTESHQNNVLRCGFGLIWKHYGKDIAKSRYVFEKIDDGLVMTIDGLDNGQDIARSTWQDVNVHTISDYFLNFNPVHANPTTEEYDTLFYSLLPRAQEYLNILIAKYIQIEHDRNQFLDAYNQSADKRWVVLDSNIEFNEVAIEQPDVLYVIFPTTNDEWGIRAIAPSSNEIFSQRLPFPVEWRGITPQELEAMTNVVGAKFCHAAGFFAVATSKESAINIVKKSLHIHNK